MLGMGVERVGRVEEQKSGRRKRKMRLGRVRLMVVKQAIPSQPKRRRPRALTTKMIVFSVLNFLWCVGILVPT